MPDRRTKRTSLLAILLLLLIFAGGLGAGALVFKDSGQRAVAPLNGAGSSNLPLPTASNSIDGGNGVASITGNSSVATTVKAELAKAGIGRTEPKPKDFTIRGTTDGLAPGVTRQLVLQVDNNNAFPIRIDTLKVSAADASASCSGTNISASPYGGGLVVPARSFAFTSIDVRMLPSAPTTCQGASFTLNYTGTGAKL